MIDKKKLETAILYLQRIADGKNPVNNMPAEEDTILNNPNVIRCMFFVKEILEEVKRNGGFIGGKPKKSAKEDFPLEALKHFVYREDKTISRFIEQVNEAVDDTVYQKLSYRPISQWLKLNGYLAEEYSQEYHKTMTVSTERGTGIGIRSEKQTNAQGAGYIRIIYGKQAQEFLVQNMEMILSGEVSEGWRIE